LLLLLLVWVLAKGIIVLLPESHQIVVIDHVDADGVIGEPDHAASGYCRKSSILQCFYLEHDSDVVWDLKSLTRWKSQELVVIQD